MAHEVTSVYHQVLNEFSEPKERARAALASFGIRSLRQKPLENFGEPLEIDEQDNVRLYNFSALSDLECPEIYKTSCQMFLIRGVPTTIWYGDHLDTGLLQKTSPHKIEGRSSIENVGLQAYRPLCLTQEMKKCNNVAQVIDAGFPVHYFRLLTELGASHALVVRRSFACSRARVSRTGKSLDTILYVSYHQYWEKVNKELEAGCQYDLHYRLANPQSATPVSKKPSVGMYRLRENNIWKEEEDLDRFAEEVPEPYHGLTLQWMVPYFRKDFYEKPGHSNFGCGLDAPYRKDFDWNHTVIVTESENSWYSYGLGRNAGVFRREFQRSSASGTMNLNTITYLKPIETESDFEIQVKDGHGSSLILKLRQLPTTLQDMKALFDVWDYHIYSPCHFILRSN